MKPKTADMPPTSQAPQTAGAGTLSKADTPARSANRGAKNAAATTTAASARAKGTSAPLPGGANSQLAQFANQLLNPARALNSWLAASSIAELRRDIAAAPEAFALLLQIRILDPILLIEGLRALSNLKSHPAFNGDTTAWFATQAGLSYKFTNQLNKAASWLYDPHAFIGVTRKKAKKAAAGDAFNTQLTPQELRRIRKEQSELRLLFRRYEASAHVIVTCMQQTNFLAAPARMQTGHVIRRVLQRLGHNPNPHLVLEYLRSEVKTMNFALKEHVSTRPRPTLRISKPDLLGQQVIEVYTSAEQAGVVREAVSAYADNNPSLFDSDAPRETRNAQALTFICATI